MRAIFRLRAKFQARTQEWTRLRRLKLDFFTVRYAGRGLHVKVHLDFGCENLAKQHVKVRLKQHTRRPVQLGKDHGGANLARPVLLHEDPSTLQTSFQTTLINLLLHRLHLPDSSSQV